MHTTTCLHGKMAKHVPLQKFEPCKGLRVFYFRHPHGANTEKNKKYLFWKK